MQALCIFLRSLITSALGAKRVLGFCEMKNVSPPFLLHLLPALPQPLLPGDQASYHQAKRNTKRKGAHSVTSTVPQCSVPGSQDRLYGMSQLGSLMTRHPPCPSICRLGQMSCRSHFVTCYLLSPEQPGQGHNLHRKHARPPTDLDVHRKN